MTKGASCTDRRALADRIEATTEHFRFPHLLSWEWAEIVAALREQTKKTHTLQKGSYGASGDPSDLSGEFDV